MSAAQTADPSPTPQAPDLLDTPAAGPAAVRGGVIRVGGYLAGVLLSVLSAALLFRHLGVDDGGRYVTVVAMLAIVTSVTELGLTTIGVRELAADRAAPRDALMRNLLGLRIALTTAGVVAAVLFSLAAGYEPAMVAGTALGGVGVLALAVQSTLGIGLMVDLRFGWVAGLDLVRQGVTVVAVILLVATGAGLVAFLAVPIPAGIVALAVTAWLVRRQVPLAPSLDARRWLGLVRDVIPVAAATAVSAVYFRVSIILLSLIAPERDTGYFGASFRVIEVLILVPSLIVGAAFPIFARTAHGDQERFVYGLDRVFQVCVIAGAWMALSLALGAPFAIEVVAGPDFAPSADVLRIQGLALLASFPGAVFFYGLLSLHRHRALLLLTGGALALNGALVAVLGSSHGAQGAALATVIAECVLVVSAGVALQRAVPRWDPSLKVIPRTALAAGLAAAPAAIPGVPSVVLVICGTIVYVAVLLLLRAVPEELLDVLPERIRPAASAR